MFKDYRRKNKQEKKKMMSTNFSKKLGEISKVLAEKGDGISYILNENDNYTIGTKIYSEKIAQYLNQTVKTWEGSEVTLANLKTKKGKDKQIKSKKVGYLWKIPITENNLQLMASK
jgi:hypothetical protein